ncbi:hypothetical protein BS640_08410 [Rouxiella badensis]|uniref:Uncharacterized protein n=1 Tax=Rouxiella badensis TaxID=1646377 RepID=A0A1X0WGR6_9GAMM|nr:hypothetical protein BS640_08410 [Rouxiella badensis]
MQRFKAHYFPNRLSNLKDFLRRNHSIPQRFRNKEVSAERIIDEISFDQSAEPLSLAHHRFSTHNFVYVNEIRQSGL